MCTFLRIDTANNNTALSTFKNVAETVVDTARTKVGFAWSEAHSAGETHNKKVRFAEYDYALGTVGTEYPIDDTDPDLIQQNEAISLVRLSSGQLICAYGLFGAQAKESSDHGATWSVSRVAVDGASGVSTRAMCSLGTDGDSAVWCITQERAGGGGGRNLYATKRTGVDTWDTAGRKTLHSAGGTSTPPYFIPDASARTGPRMLAIKPGTTGLTQCFIADFVDTGPSYKVSCLWTVDGWATVTKVDIATYPNSYDREPKMRLGADGRLRVQWIDDQNGGTVIPIYAYSDDFGQTWTIIGTPAIQNGPNGWGVGGNRGFALGVEDGWLVSTMDSESEAAPYPHRLYRGGDSLTSWTEDDCPLTFTAWLNNSGEAFVAGGNYFRVYGGIDGGTSAKSVDIIIVADVDVPGTGSPPLVTESPSGSDATNIVLRNRLSTKRGWSAHDWPFSCFAGWPEGDYTTQRRLPTKIAGVSIIDPSVDDPSALPALFAFDVPEHYGRERFMHAEDGTIVPRLDPFYRQAHTKAFAITNGVGVAIVRGVFVRYRRAGAPLSVQVWIDGVLIQTYSLPITGAAGGPDDIFPIKEVFLPVPRITNVGSFCQFRFEDESLYPFAIERVAIKKIDKVQRARNQGL